MSEKVFTVAINQDFSVRKGDVMTVSIDEFRSRPRFAETVYTDVVVPNSIHHTLCGSDEKLDYVKRMAASSLAKELIDKGFVAVVGTEQRVEENNTVIRLKLTVLK